MTTITRKQFIAELGAGGLKVDDLSPETLAKLQQKGVSVQDLKAIAGADGHIRGDSEVGKLFNLVDGFDRDGSSGTFAARDASGAPTPSGEIYQSLKAEVDRNALLALTGGGAPAVPGTPPPVSRWNPDPNATNSGSGVPAIKNTAQHFNDLEDAARSGDVKKLRALIAQGVDVNAKASDGRTALMAAAPAGNLEAMKLLIDAGARVDETSADGKTALLRAASVGQEDSVKLLLQNHADINHADNNKNTALILAARNGMKDVADVLVGEHANMNLQDKDGKTALMLAVGQRQGQMVEDLAKAGADPNIQDNDKRTALMHLIHDAHDSGQKPDFAVAQALIKASGPAGLNLKDAGGRTAMMQAASDGRKNIVMALVDAKADPDITDKNGRTAIMELLGRSRSGASSLPADQTLTSSEAKALVAASKKPDQRDKDGKSALMEAASGGHFAAVVALAGSGKVDANAQDKVGKTALIKLCFNPSAIVGDPAYLAAAKALMGAGGKILDHKDKGGTTALMAAATTGNDDMVKALNKAGANLDLQDFRGRTALMIAAKLGDRRSVRFLLDKDWSLAGQDGLRRANPSIKDKGGETAASLAQKELQTAAPYLSDLDKEKLQTVIDLLIKA